MNFTFRPIDTWPDGHLGGFTRSRFGAGYTSTLELLERELRHLDARQVVVQLALREDQIRLDGLPRSGVTPEHPGVILAFESRHGPLKYVAGTFDRWKDNLRAIALGLESLRRVDRYGITRRGEQYTGWRALSAGDNQQSEIERGRNLIVQHGGPREAQRATHPDGGGNAEDFRAVMAAIQEDD